LAAMSAHLQITSGPREGERVAVGTSLVIGRGGADLVLDDPEVSRRHAEIRRVQSGFEIEDLGSRNGTLVDGVSTGGVASLRPGSRIGIGHTELVLHADTAVEQTIAAAPPAAPREHPQPAVAASAQRPPEFSAESRHSTKDELSAIASRQTAPIIATFATMVIVPLILIVYFWQYR
jgi:predicted component of type VI protein secretion system